VSAPYAAQDRCPGCRATALACAMKEGRTNDRCCPACEAQRVQRPMHVWPQANPESGDKR
jgi:hypothetical protein